MFWLKAKVAPDLLNVWKLWKFKSKYNIKFIVFGSKSQHEKLNHSFPVNILVILISPVDAVCNLGVWFDSDFSFSYHVRKVCKACFTHVRDLKRLWGYLTHEAALMAANPLVGSHLDYCNSLFRGLSALDLRKLQCVQNSLARILVNTTEYSHITPVRKALHWLPIKYRACFVYDAPMIWNDLPDEVRSIHPTFPFFSCSLHCAGLCNVCAL